MPPAIESVALNRRQWVALPLSSLLAALPAAAQSPSDVRVALVIGNAAYPSAPLQNPGNDAQAMAQVLRGLGFDVIELRDAPRAQMAEAIARLQDSLKGKQGVGMLYYAGHGLQVDWRNYMVPVDARLASASDVPRQAVDLSGVVDAFKGAGTRMNILVLDACRDNPFGGTASGKGLAQMDAPPGTFLAYATAPGNVAEDGDGQNGLYTSFLLQELRKPAAKIEDVFKRVRLQVRSKSQGRQIPWESTSLEDDFYFQPQAARQPEAADAAERDTDAWTKAKAANTGFAFMEYLQQFPSGRFSELAQARLDRLNAPLVVPQFKPGDALANNTTTERFRLGDTFVYNHRQVFPAQPDERVRFRVTDIEDDVVKMNGGGWVFDRLGNIQQRKGNQWTDAQFFPADYQVGKKWKLRMHIETDNFEDNVDLEARITLREKVQVAAGEFEVFRLLINGFDSQRRRYAWTYWMNPRYGMPIQWTEERYNPRGAVRKNMRFELVGLQAVR